MSRRVLVAALLLAAAMPLRADFDGLVRAVSARGMRRVSVPGLGLARFAVWIVHPAGVHDFQLATFEGGAHLDNGDVAALLRDNAGSGFRPIVQTHSTRRNETTLIWARPADGDRIDFLLLTHDGKEETVVLRAVVDAEVFAKQVNDPRHARDIANR